MDNYKGFSKGNKIIEEGKVYLIFKTELVKTSGDVDTVLHYRPFYANSTNLTVSCSIPVKHAASNNIRTPVTVDELNKVMAYLATKEEFKTIDLLEEAKNFRFNSLLQTARILKQAITHQKTAGKSFDLSKKGVINNAVQMMLEEVALVYGVTLEIAFEKIKSASKTYYSRTK